MTRGPRPPSQFNTLKAGPACSSIVSSTWSRCLTQSTSYEEPRPFLPCDPHSASPPSSGRKVGASVTFADSKTYGRAASRLSVHPFTQTRAHTHTRHTQHTLTHGPALPDTCTKSHILTLTLTHTHPALRHCVPGEWGSQVGSACWFPSCCRPARGPRRHLETQY